MKHHQIKRNKNKVVSRIFRGQTIEDKRKVNRFEDKTCSGLQCMYENKAEMIMIGTELLTMM